MSTVKYKYWFQLILVIFCFFSFESCEFDGKDQSNVPITDLEPEDEFEYSDMVDFSLEEHGLDIIIKLPEVHDGNTSNIAEVTTSEGAWQVQVGGHYHLIIEDYGNENDLLIKEKERLAQYDTIFDIDFIIDDSNLIMYSRSLLLSKEGKPSFHCFGESKLNGTNFVLRSQEDGSFKPIIDDMVKTIKSAKSLDLVSKSK